MGSVSSETSKRTTFRIILSSSKIIQTNYSYDTYHYCAAILYFGYRLSFADFGPALYSLDVIVYVPFNYDYNVYEQTNRNAHPRTSTSIRVSMAAATATVAKLTNLHRAERSDVCVIWSIVIVFPLFRSRSSIAEGFSVLLYAM